MGAAASEGPTGCSRFNTFEAQTALNIHVARECHVSISLPAQAGLGKRKSVHDFPL